MKRVKLLALLFSCTALLASCAKKHKLTPEQRHYQQIFACVDSSINRGRGYADSTNYSGLLAWGESYLLRSYVEMYEATRDRGGQSC